MKTIVIVGVGALGSHAAQFLRNAAGLRVVDFDRVEQKNVLSQFHARSTTGKAKVVGLQQTFQFLFGTKVAAVPHKLVSENARELLAPADLVLDCLDNGAGRRVLQAFVRELSLPCVHGALAADGSFGRVIWDDQFRIDEEPADGAATCADGAHLPFIGMVAAFLARSAQEFLEAGHKLSFVIHPRASTTLI
jgi:molybdopterin/thiamine biosynthesis adenylyltransferase